MGWWEGEASTPYKRPLVGDTEGGQDSWRNLPHWLLHAFRRVWWPCGCIYGIINTWCNKFTIIPTAFRVYSCMCRICMFVCCVFLHKLHSTCCMNHIFDTVEYTVFCTDCIVPASSELLGLACIITAITHAHEVFSQRLQLT